MKAITTTANNSNLGIPYLVSSNRIRDLLAAHRQDILSVARILHKADTLQGAHKVTRHNKVNNSSNGHLATPSDKDHLRNKVDTHHRAIRLDAMPRTHNQENPNSRGSNRLLRVNGAPVGHKDIHLKVDTPVVNRHSKGKAHLVSKGKAHLANNSRVHPASNKADPRAIRTATRETLIHGLIQV